MSENQQRHIRVESSKYMNGLFVWNFKASFAWRGLEFQDFREYSPWDDAKYIDWARSSMEWSTIMRRYKEDKSSDILCYVDLRESLDYQGGIKRSLLNELIEFLYKASSASWEKFGWFLDTGDKVEYISPKKNPSVVHTMTSLNIQYHAYESILNISTLMNPSLKRSIIFIVSDTMNIDEKSFKTAAQKHDIIFIYLSSSFEDTLSWEGIVYLRGKWWNIAIDLSDETKKNEYISLREQEKQDFSSYLRKLWCDSMFINEDSWMQWEFLKLMKKRLNPIR